MALTPGVAYPLWKRVDDLRKERGWSKTELARRADLRHATIDNLQTSSRVPQPRIVHALADAVGLDRAEADRLASGLPDPGDDTVRAQIMQSRRLRMPQKLLLIQVYEELAAAAEAEVAGTQRPDLRAVDDGG